MTSPYRKAPIEIEGVEAHACTVDLRLAILHELPFFADLPHEAIHAINALFRAESFETGETIYYAGDPAAKLYVVATGRTKLLRHATTGQEIVLELLVPGDFFGSLPFLGEDVHADTALAHTPSCILTVTADDFQQVLRQYPQVSLSLLEITSSRLREARALIHGLSASPVEGRLAATLLKLADKLGERQADRLLIQLPLSRQDLADMTGATVETVSRIMSQFRKQGLIDSGRRWVAVLDADQLAEVAAE